MENRKALIQLLNYTKALYKFKKKTVINYKTHEWYMLYPDIPCYKDYVSWESAFEVNAEGSRVLLKVQKPIPPVKPIMDDMLKPYIDELEQKAEDALLGIVEEKKQKIINIYNEWKEEKKTYQNEFDKYQSVENLFRTLFGFYNNSMKSEDEYEFVMGNGMIENNEGICYPLLTKKIQLVFDAENNFFSFVCDEDIPAIISIDVLVKLKLEDMNINATTQLKEEMDDDISIFDESVMPEIIKRTCHRLSQYLEYAEDGMGTNEDNIIYWKPCIMYRKKESGIIAAVENLVTALENNTLDVPNHIQDILIPSQIDEYEEYDEVQGIEGRLAECCGENQEIYLTKPANKEQLEIARRLKYSNGVVVQGPPGTGKTHTIVNLLGHFLAEGKKVLVVSHTAKALSVLRDKLDDRLKPLCISLLEDNNNGLDSSIKHISEAISSKSISQLKEKINSTGKAREEVIQDLGEIRKKIYKAVYTEKIGLGYIVDNQTVSPTMLAKFLYTHENLKDIVPDAIKGDQICPLKVSELEELYRSNGVICDEYEPYIDMLIKYKNEIITPQEIKAYSNKLEQNIIVMRDYEDKYHWLNTFTYGDTLQFKTEVKVVHINKVFLQDDAFIERCKRIKDKIKEWNLPIVLQAKLGSGYSKLWEDLCEDIKRFCHIYEEYVEVKSGYEITAGEDILKEQIPVVNSFLLRISNEEKGSFFDKITEWLNDNTLNSIQVNQKCITKKEEADFVLFWIKYREEEEIIKNHWNDLMTPLKMPKFEDVPYNKLNSYVKHIEEAIEVGKNEINDIEHKLMELGLHTYDFNKEDLTASEKEEFLEKLAFIEDTVPAIYDYVTASQNKKTVEEELKQKKAIIDIPDLQGVLCIDKMIKFLTELESGLNKQDLGIYTSAYLELKNLWELYAVKIQRDGLLHRLGQVAPRLADCVRMRKGIHSESTMPTDFMEAWKWKQYDTEWKTVMSLDLKQLMKNHEYDVNQYRKLTIEYVEYCAWYHIIKRAEEDRTLKQALEAWNINMGQLGTGKSKSARAKRIKKEARSNMKKCQHIVPVWIMTINKALEVLNTDTNHFDIVIIDEASQATLEALAVLCLGDKAIVVGDHNQVSPINMAINAEAEEMVKEEHLQGINSSIRGILGASTSIYDLSKTTFSTVMLKEHFRCVPDIIGFSNLLSYNGDIKPLRDSSSSNLLPALINYRVDGERKDKLNEKEANVIVALMKACIDSPLYKDKTFGVIPLLSGGQDKLIISKIYDHIPSVEIERRKIVCGVASDFQGDERDVIFLSMVDSKNLEGTPLRKTTYGADDRYKKRYNVAVSRARDQLWVINSLDKTVDLQVDDIRRTLLDYVDDPRDVQVLSDSIERSADSPFEKEVAMALVSANYKIKQQWEVGKYRIDMVAIDGNNKVAIECDGERFHSGEDKVREDMERQVILERIGWKFIRIRGGEYYRNKKDCIERVKKELCEFGIQPQANNTISSPATSPLLEEIKIKACHYLQEIEGKKNVEDEGVKNSVLF